MPKSLKESIPFQEAMKGVQVEEGTGIIRGVAILSQWSNNDRHYSEDVRTKALPLFENVPVYANHSVWGGRDVRDLMGSMVNPRIDGKYTRGDFVPMDEKSDFIGRLMKANIQGPGFSMCAWGESEPEKGEDGKIFDDVTEITNVYSVDLVDTPACTSGLFESAGALGETNEGQENEHREEKSTMELKDVTQAMLTEHRPDLVESIQKPLKEEVETLTGEIQRMKTAGKEADEVIAEAIETCPQLGGLFKGLRESMTKMPDKASMKEMATAAIANAPTGVGSGTTFVGAETKDGKDEKRKGKTSRADLYEEDGGGE